MNDYRTMKEIGRQLGLTSHQVGKRLKELGLRTPGGRPSHQAFEEGLVAQRWAPDGENYLWAWKGEAITALLGGPPRTGQPTKEQQVR